MRGCDTLVTTLAHALPQGELRRANGSFTRDLKRSIDLRTQSYLGQPHSPESEHDIIRPVGELGSLQKGTVDNKNVSRSSTDWRLIDNPVRPRSKGAVR
jgi:hypothetical protein